MSSSFYFSQNIKGADMRNWSCDEEVVKNLSFSCWFLGFVENDFFSLLHAFDFLVTFPHTEHKHAACVFDYPWESALPAIQSSNVRLQLPAACSVSPEVVSWEAVSCLDPECPGFPAPPPSPLPQGPLLCANSGLLPPTPHQEGGCPFVWSLLPFSSRLVLTLSWTHRARGYCQHTVLSDSHAPVHAWVLISDKTSSQHTEFQSLYSFRA